MNYCEFLRKFFEDEKNISQLLDPLLTRCAQLKSFYADDRLIYGRSEMPLTSSKIGEFVERRDYWSQAEEYSLLLNQLHEVMWEKVKLRADPKKPKKVKKKKAEENEQTPP